MKQLIRLTGFITFVLLLCPFAFADQTPLKIHVSILPQKYFVEKIAGNLADVDVLVKPGKSPATYSPTPSQVKALSGADIYFRIGVPFENGFLHKVESVAKTVKIVDCRRGIPLREMKAHVHEDDHEQDHDHEAEHDHDDGHDHATDHHDADHPDDEHDHTGKDPHIWMSPELVKIQAGTILSALVEMDPANRETYTRNHAVFCDALEALHQQLSEVLRPFQGENLFVFHPAFGYFADAYGMHQIAVETMGKAPKGKDLAAIIKLAKKENASVIFVQPQFDQSTAQKIASAINGHVVRMNPLGYDYIDNMKQMAAAVSQNLKNQ